MNERERLIELLNRCDNDFTKTCPQNSDVRIDCASCKYNLFDGECDYTAREADYLLENGVAVLPPVGEKPINLEDFSIRTYNCLMRAGIDTIGNLSKLTYDDLSKIRNLGIKSIAEIIDKLRQYGYNIGFDAYGKGAKQK